MSLGREKMSCRRNETFQRRTDPSLDKGTNSIELAQQLDATYFRKIDPSARWSADAFESSHVTSFPNEIPSAQFDLRLFLTDLTSVELTRVLSVSSQHWSYSWTFANDEKLPGTDVFDERRRHFLRCCSPAEKCSAEEPTGSSLLVTKTSANQGDPEKEIHSFGDNYHH